MSPLALCQLAFPTTACTRECKHPWIWARRSRRASSHLLVCQRPQGCMCLRRPASRRHNFRSRTLLHQPLVPSGTPTIAVKLAAIPSARAVAGMAKRAPVATCASGIVMVTRRQQIIMLGLILFQISRRLAPCATPKLVGHRASMPGGREAAAMVPIVQIATCASGGASSQWRYPTKTRVRCRLQ